MNRYIIGALACMGLAILLIILLTTTHKAAAPSKTVNLVSYANTNAVVEMIIDGPIVAPENHNSLDVSVSQYNTTFTLKQGYNGHVIKSKIFNNTENSFSNFLYALYYAGYTEGIKSNFTTDEGLCAAGDRYDFYLIDNGATIQHYWITGCSSLPKTYDGNLTSTIGLFNAQVPNFTTLAAGANL